EGLVEAALAHQLRRQLLDVVRRRDEQHAGAALGHPREQAAKHSPRRSTLVVAGRDALLDLVEPQDARAHSLDNTQGLSQVALGFSVILVVQRTEIEAEQRHLQRGRGGLRGEALAAALHSDQQDALWRIESRRAFGAERGSALMEPHLHVAKARDLVEARGVVL